MAAFFGGWPHDIWSWPFHYYVNVRREYLKIQGLGPQNEKQPEAYVQNVTVEHYDY